MLKVLVVGNSGREHAIAWKLAESSKVSHVFVAPGNAGTSLLTKSSNVALTRIADLIRFACDNQIDFTVVGPEAPLAAGIVDQFKAHGLKIWGPTQYCAQLESSKSFAKNFMQKHNIPTAKYQTFYDLDSARNYIMQEGAPIVVKADGLASGKGVVVANSVDEALDFVNDIFIHNKFAHSTPSVVVEECLTGEEASFIVMIDGKNILPLATSQDHKRLLNDDMGPNTGGMGAYSPAPIVTDSLHAHIISEVIQPVIDGMLELGHTYHGFLYAGLMIDTQNNFKVLEFNCRLGDPETQPILCRLESDFAQMIELALQQKLDQYTISWSPEFAVGVILAAEGYPEQPRNNDIITGVEEACRLPNIHVLHSGTKLVDGKCVTNGGRVLCVVATNMDAKIAKQNVYDAIKLIHFDGIQYRTDIAKSI